MTKTRTQKTITILVRIALILAVIAAIIMGVLKLAERSTEPLRLGLQDYLTQTTGNPAEIGTLENAQLFPKISFTIKSVLIRDKDNRDKALVTADSIYIVMNFWKTFFGMRDYEAFKIENLETATGYALPKKLSLSFVGISDPQTNQTPPYFLFDGTYNNRPLLITARMKRQGKKNFSYKFESEFPVTFKLGETEANAMFKRSLTKLDFAQITLVSGGQEALLSAPDMSFDPLHIPLKGKVAGVPVTGELKQVDQVYTLSLTPGKTDAKSLADINKFVTAVKKDLGIDAKTKNIVITINAAIQEDDKKESKE